ncbi:polyprenol phosphomannose-dependent alpha 1,6 mannosyltransferase MptB [Nocardia farcinica]|uniref:polyprenol phosphomannose-dependent alpha 1,6 mannosyltransferase MptB n=1 Tax=Nocardia TaxID=1817 RepID=UPI000320F44D|nr:polyprenol phosphomannose-dependent alpha 1,6 mannosyltransferase MptB [Nocardia farcinica]MBC9816373.1 polyprenol phosphomannose-dependent alpha 1,6 mannosyltransferase MptB [Nocardia farcinica]MBF6185855.1 polyprenol phosphomannose-dependent alpha 1,6 mannosyltransferase MptB [Nocardia farcinica]MBF6229777.1 polyprenol phosphomannose-dependent alpha 1,6 mannosyltransferase MptB [Nocardia farcinica]MBF6256598.1 polyprenol phosphomannose-dependent alpha 1,6 mannosyltransferase MptB [Nocardia
MVRLCSAPPTRLPLVAVLERARRRTSALGRRALGLDVPAADHTVAVLHRDEIEVPELDRKELVQLDRIRLLGATGTVLMAISALGIGAQPVQQNPTSGMRVLGIFARAHTGSLAMCMIGAVVVVLAWLLLGRFAIGGFGDAPRHRLTRSQLDRTLLLWIIPLSVAPPLFSNDVYSYLAQSEIAARGIDPYQEGPVAGLGIDNVLTNNVPTIWRDTPAPYGPLFLWVGRGIAELTGDNIILGVWVHRVLALAGVALIVWALPRLSVRCGVAPVSALWLGAANPLVLFHLVGGVHNDALMIGLMLAGVEFALRAIEDSPVFDARAYTLLIGGSLLIALSSSIKITSLIAMGFVGMALARRWGGTLRAVLVAAALLGAIALGATLFISSVSGLGFGWIHTLNTASAVRSWMSLPTAVGIITGFGGVLLGLGDHTTALLSITRPIAGAVAGFVVVRMLVATGTGRLHPVGALGVSLGAIVLLFPVVQPWYLLWAIVPLAAWATRPVFRVPAVAFSAVVSVLQMPRGADLEVFQIVGAAIATTIVCVLFIVVTRNALPWRAQTGVSAPSQRTTSYGVSS